jgi:uncharacterized damage-inducible protein DinB
MDPGVEPWVQLWDYLDGNFWSVWHWSAQQLSAEEVGWQPIPEVASIGWNLEHLAEMLDYYLAHIFGQGAPRSLLVTMRSGSRDDGRFHDLQAIAAYHREVRPRYRTFLAGLTLADLGQAIDRAGKRPITYAWAVGHIAEHESYHIGKCTLLKSLLAAWRRNT